LILGGFVWLALNWQAILTTISPAPPVITPVVSGVSVGPIISQGNLSGPAAIYPRKDLSPGAINPEVTQENISQTICKAGWTATIRPSDSYTTKLKKEIMAAYGFSGSTADYELDHIISLELGGAPADPKNLWPEAYGDINHNLTASERSQSSEPDLLPGALQKDRVETGLKREICKGEISLARAQQIIVDDWYACYLVLTADGICK
jgi:hypothetical protein